MKYQFYGYDFEIHEDELSVVNNSGVDTQIWFIKPSNLFAPYSYGNFNNSVWCRVKPSKWIDQSDNFKVNIELIQKDKLYLFEMDIITMEIKDISNPMIKVHNFEIQPVSISVIISSYESEKYIEDCLISLTNQSSKYYNFDILLGIDNCTKTLRKLYDLTLPDSVKVFYFEENVGKFVVVNTLSAKSNSEFLLFFDSDDISLSDIFPTCKYLENNDMLIFNCLSFEDGQNHLESTHITNIGGCIMIRRDKFMSLNGFQPWRCSGDDEFIRRCRHHGLNMFSPENPVYYYRIRNSSLSRSKIFNTNSNFRGVYRSILTKNQTNQNWPNPRKLFTDRCFKIF